MDRMCTCSLSFPQRVASLDPLWIGHRSAERNLEDEKRQPLITHYGAEEDRDQTAKFASQTQQGFEIERCEQNRPREKENWWLS